MKILIVDDDVLVAASLRRLLRRHGFTVSIAHCGLSALEGLDAFAPDVVLSDFKMPGMNGAQLLAMVEALRPGTRLILLSGYADLDHSTLGNVLFLPKPWDDAQLVRACEQPQ